MMKLHPFVILALTVLITLPAYSEIFQWTDTEGNVVFGDRPPPSQKAKRIELEINSYESVTVESFTPFEGKRTSREKSVVLYSTSWCGFCRKARNYLRQHKISFAEYDVEKSEKGRRDYQELNGHGVPIILVGDKRMNGFSVERFKSLYGS